MPNLAIEANTLNTNPRAKYLQWEGFQLLNPWWYLGPYCGMELECTWLEVLFEKRFVLGEYARFALCWCFENVFGFTIILLALYWAHGNLPTDEWFFPDGSIYSWKSLTFNLQVMFYLPRRVVGNMFLDSRKKMNNKKVRSKHQFSKHQKLNQL